MINTIPIQYKNNYKTCLSFDPAIDATKSNIEEFKRTRDLSHLTFYPNQEPTWFYFNYIDTYVHMNFVTMQARNAAQIPFFCFKYGLSRVENLKPFCTQNSIDISHFPIPVWEPTGNSKLYNGQTFNHASDDEVWKLFNLITVVELGGYVLEKNFSPRQ